MDGAPGKLAGKLECCIPGKEQQSADKEDRYEIEHHRPKKPFTALAYRRSSEAICSGVRAGRFCIGWEGSARRNVASQTTTPAIYAKRGVILTIGSTFVPNSERSK